MVLRKAQMRWLADVNRHGFEQELFEHSTPFAPALCALAGPENTRAAIRRALDKGRRYGFSLRGPLRLFFEMALAFGSEFDTDPQLRWAAEELANRDFADEMLRADHFFRRAVEY